MARTRTTGTDRTDGTERYEDFYLPATARLSTAPGPVERFLTSLFRRRGSYRLTDENADDTVWR